MLSLKEIKKVMKEFDKTADEALDFLIQQEHEKLAKLRKEGK